MLKYGPNSFETKHLKEVRCNHQAAAVLYSGKKLYLLYWRLRDHVKGMQGMKYLASREFVSRTFMLYELHGDYCDPTKRK